MAAVSAKILEQVERLPEELQERVLDFARGLAAAVPSGVPGERLAAFAGSISQAFGACGE
ncbi:MAG: hypothetical protein V1750_10450 [Acidobacteriota bacterium]